MEGVAHTLFKERGLQPAAAQLWNGCRTAEEGDSLMKAEHSGGTRFAVYRGKKA